MTGNPREGGVPTGTISVYITAAGADLRGSGSCL